MSTPLRVLMVEDSKDDATVLLHVLRRGGYDPLFEQVETAPAMRAALEKQAWDIVISDYMLPEFGGPEALTVLKESRLDVPFVVVSGAVGEEAAVEILLAGAHDFIRKDKLARLLPAVRRELREAEDRRQRREAETALRMSEARFRAMLEALPDMMFRLSREGVFLDFKPAPWARPLVPPSEFLGRRVSEVMPEAVATETTRAVAQALQTETAQLFEYQLVVEGRLREFEARCVPSGPDEVLAIVRDITERKRAEEAYQSLVENSLQGLLIYQEGRFVFANPASATVFGYSVEELLALSPESATGLIHPADRARVQARLRNRLAGQLVPPRTEFRALNKNGETVWLEAYATLIKYRGQPAIQIVTVDVTERKQAEAALRASEERYRTLAETAHDAIFIINRDDRIDYLNSFAARQLGGRPEDFVGKPRAVLFPSGVSDRQRRSLQHVLETGEPLYVETKTTFPSGEVWLGTWLVALRNEAGEVYAVLGVSRDITERKRAEAALAANERRFRALIENSSDVISLIGADGTILYESPSGSRVHGYASEELAGQNAFERIHPDDVQSAARLFAEVLQGLRRNATGRLRVRHRDGSWRWIEAVAADLLAEPSVEAVVINYRDVTERKEAEERLRLQSAAMESAANAIVITDRNGNITWVNPAFTRLTGYAPEEVLGQNPRILKSGQQDQAFYRNLWETVLAGQVWQGEIVNRRKDGTLYTEEMTVTPVVDEGGVISHFVGIKHDVTDRKQAEAELLRRHEELAAIAAVSSALRTAQTRAEMLPVILSQVRELLKTDGADLSLRDPISGETVVELANGAWAHYAGLRYPPGAGVSGHVIATGQAYVSDDLLNDPRVYRPELVGGLRAGACIPLIVQGQTIGALWAARPTLFAESDVRLLTAIADIAANAIHRMTLYEQTEQRLERLDGLRAIDEAITASLDLRVTLNVLLDQVTTQLRVGAADVLLLNPNTHTLEYAAGRGFRTSTITRTRLRLGEGYAGRAALERRVVSTADLSESDVVHARPQLLGDEGFVAHHAAPLIAKGHVKGVLEIFHRAALNPDPEWLDYLETLAGQTAIAVDNIQLFESLQRSNLELGLAYDATIEGWSRALDLRDKETEGHTRRVTETTFRLARTIGIGEEELVYVRWGALLHDIGKMGIPDGILLKPGALTDEEWAIMRKHPEYAHEMLYPIAYLRRALDIPYCHHEKWDGTGYPRGLKGEQIPLPARIFAVVDVWDALLSDRPYRAAWPEEKVRDYIRSLASAYFDPKVVEAFLALEA
jgi:PAS domain S-box-containing protein/putative nucleotidyltransferase with HDIG domain